MKKRICIIAFFSLCVLLMLFATTANAEGGKCGDNLTWSLDNNGVLTISGTGDMYDYVSIYNDGQKAPWGTDIKKVIVEEGVTSIGQYAFGNCTQLTEISIREGLTRINNMAFNYTTQLRNISLPTSLQIIEGSAFASSGIRSLFIPANVISIGSCYSSNLNEIIVSPSNPAYSSEDGILYNKDKTILISCPGGKTGSVNIPDGVQKLSYKAFYFCSRLTGINIPNSVNIIEEQCFNGCSSLTELILPSSLESLTCYFTFSYCSNLESIILPGCVPEIGYHTFWNCGKLTNVSIPPTVTSIDNSAFQNCSNVTISCHKNSAAESFAINNGFPYTNQGHDEIIDIAVEPTCTENGSTGGIHCSLCGLLTTRIIPALGHDAADEIISAPSCTEAGLKKIICTRCGEVLEDSVYIHPHSLVPHDKEEATCTETGTEEYWVCSDCRKLFSDSDANTEIDAPVVIPAIGHRMNYYEMIDSTCTTTGKEAYWSCVNCKKYFSDEDATQEIDSPDLIPIKAHTLIMHPRVLPDSNTIGTETYWECSDCGKLFADAYAMTEIGAPIQISTYGICGNNASWTLSEGGVLTIYGSGDMSSHPWTPNDIKSLVVENGITGICSEAFLHCHYLTKVTLPASLTHIDNDAFSNCSRLTSVSLSEGLRNIGEWAFFNCENLLNITIPDSVVSIGDCAFTTTGQVIYAHFGSNGAKALGKANLAFRESDWSYSLKYKYSNNQQIGLIICNVDENITRFTIPEGVTEIGNGAFADHTSLTEISIPEGVNTVGSSAFFGCTGLTSLILPDTVTAIYSNAFSNCTRLRTITINGLLEYIGDYVFANCTALSNLEIMTPFPRPQNNAYPFASCYNLETVTILEGSTTISANNFVMFGSGTSLRPTSVRQIYVPDSLTNIGIGAFGGISIIVNCDSFAHRWAKANLHEYEVTEHKNLVVDDAIAPTCTSSGLTEGTHCSTCGDVIVAQQTVPAPGHSIFYDDAIQATCLDTGLTEGTHCSVCGEILIAQKVIPSPGHSWNSPSYSWDEDNTQITAVRICKNNNEHIETETVGVTSNIKKEASCVSPGEIEYTSNDFINDGFVTQTKVLSLQSLGHDWRPAEYSWNDDNTMITATRVCNRDSSHIESETVTVTKTIHISTDGTATILWASSPFANKAFTEQSKTKQVTVNVSPPEKGSANCHFSYSAPGASIIIGNPMENFYTRKATWTVTYDEESLILSIIDSNWIKQVLGDDSFTVTIQDNQYILESGNLLRDAGLNEPRFNFSIRESTLPGRYDVKIQATDSTGSVLKEKSEYVLVSQHSFSHLVEKQLPTDSECGYEEYACSCGALITIQTVPALKDLNVIRIPNNVVAIEKEAFSNLACQAIIIPEGCITIDENAFAGCSNLIYVRIPSTVMSYPANAFEDCNADLVIDWTGH